MTKSLLCTLLCIALGACAPATGGDTETRSFGPSGGKADDGLEFRFTENGTLDFDEYEFVEIEDQLHVHAFEFEVYGDVEVTVYAQKERHSNMNLVLELYRWDEGDDQWDGSAIGAESSGRERGDDVEVAANLDAGRYRIVVGVGNDEDDLQLGEITVNMECAGDGCAEPMGPTRPTPGPMPPLGVMETRTTLTHLDALGPVRLILASGDIAGEYPSEYMGVFDLTRALETDTGEEYLYEYTYDHGYFLTSIVDGEDFLELYDLDGELLYTFGWSEPRRGDIVLSDSADDHELYGYLPTSVNDVLHCNLMDLMDVSYFGDDLSAHSEGSSGIRVKELSGGGFEAQLGRSRFDSDDAEIDVSGLSRGAMSTRVSITAGLETYSLRVDNDSTRRGELYVEVDGDDTLLGYVRCFPDFW